MYNLDQNKNYQYDNSFEVASATKTFMTGVFSWMFLALTVTAITSYLFGTSENLLSMLINPEAGGMTGFGWFVMLSPLGFVLIMSMGYNKLSSPVLTLLFTIFAVLMGMSLSFIFLAYTLGSIFATFGICAGMFGVMAIAGYTTSTDLTKMGSLLFMALIGIIIASVVNMFMQSGTMQYVISFLGVLIFTGLTAYDVQKLKRIGETTVNGSESMKKAMIMGALNLYLDFINLFLFLLRFFGNRK
ncbi:MAG: Bax inhibitor-1/YccA family protein [Bacteroidota bacterium]